MSNSVALSNQEVLSILRNSPALTQAIENKELRQKKRETAKRRSELTELRRSRLNELQDAYTEVEREIMEVKEQLRQIKNRRAGIVMAQISERHSFDMQINEIEHFLRQHASFEILTEIKRLQNLKAELPSKLTDWRQGPLIDDGWPRVFTKKPKFGSNLREIKQELKECDSKIADLNEQILLGKEGIEND